MIYLKSFEAYVRPPHGVGLFWSMDGLASGDTITVQRAESPGGPWVDLATLDFTSVSYIDQGVMSSSIWRSFFWRLIVRRPPSSDDLISCNPITLGPRITRELASIAYKHHLYLYGRTGKGKGLGRWLACYKQPMLGPTCPVCVDPDTLGILIETCDYCGGTRRESSWPQPILFRGRFEGTLDQVRAQGLREYDMDRRQMRTSNWPPLEAGDHLVEKGTHHVWRVTGQPSVSMPNGVLMSQVCSCERVHNHAIVARLEYPQE